MTHPREAVLINKLCKHWTFLSIIISLTIFVYLNALCGEPIFDDIVYTFADPLFLSPHSFIDLNLWEAFKGGVRPVTAFTFSLNHYLFGKETLSYHITNLLIHIANGILVYVFIYVTLTLFSRSPLAPLCQRAECKEDFVRERWIAFLTSLLFSIHPIQTESVSYIYQRSESLSSLFYLSSLMLFIFAARRLDVRGSNASRQHYTSVILYILFVIGFVLALGSKEIAVTLPATAFLYGIFFFEKKGLWKKVAVPFLLIIAGLFVAAVRLIILKENPSAGYYLKELTAWEYLLTQFSVIVNYLRLLLFPVGQNIDHWYSVTRSIFEARAIASIGFLSAILIVAGALYRRWGAGSFFILWFFLLLLPSSSILPLKDLLVEHRLYLPSIGVFFVIASGTVGLAGILRERAVKRTYLTILVSVVLSIVTALLAATYKRNYLWNSRVAMWQDVVEKSPRKERAHYNLGCAYNKNGMTDRAIEEYQIALQLDPYYVEVHNNLGLAYNNKGWNDKAIEEYSKALQLKPDYVDAYNNLGLAYAEKGWYDKAIEQYQIALRWKPTHVEAHNNLGLTYVDKDMIDDAIEEYQAALRQRPAYLEAHYNLGLAYKRKGWLDRAIEQFETTVRLKPYYYVEAHNNLGLSYHAKGLVDKAIEQYRIVLMLKPEHLRATYNLGLAYLGKGLYRQAIEQFEVALKLKPDYVEAQENLGNCYFILGDYKRSLEEYLKTLKLDLNDFNVYYNTGLCLKKFGKQDIARGFFGVFVRYGPEKYVNEKKELIDKYNITRNMAVPDKMSLISKAKEALGQVKEGS